MAAQPVAQQQQQQPQPQQQGPANNTAASASLYVGDLAPDVDEAKLYETFNAVGPVSSIRVCRDTHTRRSLGYAYVNFYHIDDAERCFSTMNFKPINKRPCRIMFSHRDPSLRKSGVGNVFVKNLDKKIDNKTLFDTFSIYGNILSCKVCTDRNTGESLGYGFVHYDDKEAAARAVLQTSKIEGHPVTVQHFKAKKDRESQGFTNLYMKNLADDTTQASLRAMFEPYGNINSVYLQRHEGKNAGLYGFVNFDTPEQADAACKALNGKVVVPAIEGKQAEKKLYVGRALKKEDRKRMVMEQKDKRRRDRQNNGVNLFVKNLADTVTTERLLSEFQSYGDIKSARVMVDPQTNLSKGHGFVCFADPDSAHKALEMNSKMVDGKPLFVAYAVSKEERKAQNEQRIANRAKQPGMGPAVYPQQLFHQRMMFQPQPVMWGQAPPMMMRPPHQSYALIPANMPPNRAGGAPRRGGRGGRQNMGMQRGGMQQQPGFKYSNNVRNQGQPQPMPQMMHAAPADAPIAQPHEVAAEDNKELIKQLASMSSEQAKNVIGERLYPMVSAKVPDKGAKITGMLLEMDNAELVHLLDSKEALQDKINEALHVLAEQGDVEDDGHAQQ